jgi:hypothetical protein
MFGRSVCTKLPLRVRFARWIFVWQLFAAIPVNVAAAGPITAIDLRLVGYPEPPCDYLFQDSDAYEKRHIEFLDSEHLLVSFPFPQARPCPADLQLSRETFRSVVLDLSGNEMSSFDWNRAEIFNVQAGPDGHILAVTAAGIRVMDKNFRPVQEIPLPSDAFPRAFMPMAIAIELPPSRHGFTVIFGRGFSAVSKGYSVYFGGETPVKEEFQENTNEVAVGDGILAPLTRGNERRTLSINQKSYACAKARWIVIPTTESPICLTSNFQLVEMREGGNQSVIANLRSLAPGRNSGFRYELTDANSGRLLLDSHGARFAITDSSGFGYYRLVAIYDLRLRKQVYRAQFPISSDVAVSPNGNLLAVREKAQLKIHRIP